MKDVKPASTAIVSGVETLVRLLVLRRQLDQRDGLDTATMVSGYPGSPLGGFDLTLEAQAEALTEHRILHRPGVNEELAVTIAWGSQMGRAVPYAGVDGVAAVWYGKTPGLDRSGDALRHANALGSGPNGGFVVFCGDDPTAKSSTFGCDSQHTFEDLCIPVLYPGDQQEIIDLGVHAFRLSRFAGPMVGLKIVTTVADGIGTIDTAAIRHPPSTLPEVVIDGQPWRHEPLVTIGPHRIPDQEMLVVHKRLVAAKAYVRANGLDQVKGAAPGARLGIVCAGKTYYDVVQAFADLGVSLTDVAGLGVRILKLAMTYPVVDETVSEFARSVQELVVIEEKRPFMETQIRALLHEVGIGTPLRGKRDRDGRPLVSMVTELSTTDIAAVLARVIPDLPPPALRVAGAAAALQLPPRSPAYCSGCPHNRSTVVPVNALAGGGIGCHGIMYFEARQKDVQKVPPPPMGAEGVPWIGLAPFVAEKHLIQNIGDGTLSHSGSLAIRAAVAAKVNITFKILYNGAVAMTGGQEVTGLLDVPALTRSLEAEGVRKIVVCAADPERYDRNARWAPGVEIHKRDDLAKVQETLREVQGTTIIIYDQRCAAEMRRMRKRGLLEEPPARVVINEAVCENCGDCVVKSNCTSVQSHSTEFGDKKHIDNLNCNRDYTCLEGDCPSFVTITPEKGASKKRAVVRPKLPAGSLPLPVSRKLDDQFGVYFTGIGGTGVVTANRILAMATEAAGYVASGMDQTGLAQKGGAVASHLHIAASPDKLGSGVIGRAGADLYLSGDILQAAAPAHLDRAKTDGTLVVEAEITPTAAMMQMGSTAPDPETLQSAMRERAPQGRALFINSKRLADAVFADPVLANVILLGAAFQAGGSPFSLADMEAAFKRQGRAADKNLAAFTWGRWAAHDPSAVEAALAAASMRKSAKPFEPSADAMKAATSLVAGYTLPQDLASLLTRRTAQVIDYQSAGLARRFLDLVARAAGQDSAAQDWKLTRAVVESWFKLLTYKDEYEVARLHTATDYDAIAGDLGIEGAYTLNYHLHPPVLRRFGLRHKLPMGKTYAALFGVLKHLKRLRGTPLDVFGWDHDRRLEREVANEYERLMTAVLGARSYERAVELAASALQVKGYGPVKERNVVAWRSRVAALR